MLLQIQTCNIHQPGAYIKCSARIAQSQECQNPALCTTFWSLCICCSEQHIIIIFVILNRSLQCTKTGHLSQDTSEFGIAPWKGPSTQSTFPFCMSGSWCDTTLQVQCDQAVGHCNTGLGKGWVQLGAQPKVRCPDTACSAHSGHLSDEGCRHSKGCV